MSKEQKKYPGNAPKIAWTKRARKSVYRRIGQFRSQIAQVSPVWLRDLARPVFDYLEMILYDHGIFRVIYANRYKISPNAWRSSQPWPHQVRHYARTKGIRTIVNLRGVRDCASFRLETKACEDYGIALRNDLKIYSRGAPKKEIILEIGDYFKNLNYPILFHCKSGADRVGLVSTLYLHLMEGIPIEEARSQLSLRYGHFKQAKTGILDHFFDQYLDYAKTREISFLEWVETVYDESALVASFQSSRFTSVLVDKILQRE